MADYLRYLALLPVWWARLGQTPHGQQIVVGGALVAIVGMVLLSFLGAHAPEPPGAAQRHIDVEPSRKAYKPRGTLYVPLVLDNVTIDLQPKLGASMHTAVIGPTGLGKSTAVLSLFDLDIAVVAVALDNTRPIRKKVLQVGGTDWTNDPRECSIGLDLLNISVPSATAELIVSGLPKATGDSGQWRRAAIARLTKTFEMCDQAGVERNWPMMIEALKFETGDRPADTACTEWASKLQQIYDLCGQNFGVDLNLVDAIRNREKVLLRTNHFLSTEVGPMVGGWLMILARLAAHEANMPFVLIIEEANQAETFAKYISPVAQAARDRDVMLVSIGQNGSKLPDEVVQNTKVWVCSPQVLDKERRFCASMLDLEPDRMQISRFPKTNPPSDQGLGWFFVSAPGLPTSLVHLPDPKKQKQTRVPRMGTSRDSARPDMGSGRWEPVTPRSHDQAPEHAINHWRPWTPQLPAPSEDLGDAEPEPIPELEREPYPAWMPDDAKFRLWWDTCQRVGPSALWCPCHGLRYDDRGCFEWTGTTTNPTNGAPARPRQNYKGKDARPYRFFFKLFYGFEAKPTVDHLCDNPLCNEVSHLEACDFDVNVQRQAERERIFRGIGWERIERMHQSPGMREPVRVARWSGKCPAAA